MLQVFLYGPRISGFLDLFPDAVLELEEMNELFTNFEIGTYSLPIDIPWTDNNRRITNFAERLQNGKPAATFFKCDIYDEGYPVIQSGKLTILEKSGKFDYRSGQFSATISGTKGLFGSQVKDINMRSLPLPILGWFASESRDFAKDVMDGVYPDYNMISFAPLVIENFFEAENDNGEFLAKDTVNNIIVTGGIYAFARPKSTDGTPTLPGQEEHIDYRTVPFIKFKWLLRKAFDYVGYEPFGEILDSEDFNDLHFFNSVAIEQYNVTAFRDFNRKITLANHVPDMLLSDFFKSVFSFFNIYPVFLNDGRVELRYRKKVITEKKVLDITAHTNPEFTSRYEDADGEPGYTIAYSWDPADGYISDRSSDIDETKVIAVVQTTAGLATINIGRPLTTDDIIYVVAENMYYRPANTLVTPILWDAYSERLGGYKSEAGTRVINIGMGTLCTYVLFNETEALYTRQDKLACRMSGNYINNRNVRINNPFGLSVFYIKKQTFGAASIPTSYNHNLSPTNAPRARYSLALQTEPGIAQQLHKEWQEIEARKEIVSTTITIDRKLIRDLSRNNTVKINNLEYFPFKSLPTVPLGETLQIELVPL